MRLNILPCPFCLSVFLSLWLCVPLCLCPCLCVYVCAHTCTKFHDHDPDIGCFIVGPSLVEIVTFLGFSFAHEGISVKFTFHPSGSPSTSWKNSVYINLVMLNILGEKVLSFHRISLSIARSQLNISLVLLWATGAFPGILLSVGPLAGPCPATILSQMQSCM